MCQGSAGHSTVPGHNKGCSVTGEDYYGHIPLMLSLMCEHWIVASFLLQTVPNSVCFMNPVKMAIMVSQIPYMYFNETSNFGKRWDIPRFDTKER